MNDESELNISGQTAPCSSLSHTELKLQQLLSSKKSAVVPGAIKRINFTKAITHSLCRQL